MIQRLRRPAAAIAAIVAVGIGLPGPVASRAASTPRIEFTETTLDNGLRIVVHADRTAPVFSIAVSYDVGSRNEREGRTGFAHLFEHMMFKGSANVGSGEHFLLIFNNGGDMNGTTSKDRTLYFERLPSNQLDLALFLEADRMRSLEITAENLENQRQAVKEERRLRVDNQPYGQTFEAVDELAYDNFAYAHSVIGSMDDLDAATVDDVAEFFKTYYAPNNAVLAISGDVDVDGAVAKVRQYFGTIPRQPAPPAVEVEEPLQTAERRRTIEDPLARLPRLDLAYDAPSSLTPDHDALSVLATILSSGRSARLYERIVRQQQLATNVSASAGESRGPGLFRVVALATPATSPEALEAALLAEVERIKTEPVAAWELEKARSIARRGVVGSLGSSLQRAVLLSTYELFHGDPGLINTRAERLASVTAADVQRVARQYLVASGRTVVVTVPKADDARGDQ